MATPFNPTSNLREGELGHLRTERISPVASTKSSGLSRLKNHVHASRRNPSHAPSPRLGFQVAEIERILKPNFYASNAAGNLARDERLAAERAFMIEQNAVLANATCHKLRGKFTVIQ